MPVTLFDIAKLNGSDQVVGLIEENRNAAPELNVLPARTIRGTNYKVVLRTGYPGVGFRAANEGSTPSSSTFANRLIECYILASAVRADKAVAMAYEDGAASYMAMEASGVMQQAMIEIGSQIIYGTSVDAKGFPGLNEIFTDLNNGIVVDAGGTTASTGSSVWGLNTSAQGVQLIFGSDTTFTLGDWREQQVADSNNKLYAALVADLTAWVGMQVGSKYSIGRLKDATADSGKGVTDAKLAELLALYPIGYQPNVWLMNRRSAAQLQASRSSTVIQNGPKSSTGVEIWAPFPTESNGIPIVVTDSIGNTEALS